MIYGRTIMATSAAVMAAVAAGLVGTGLSEPARERTRMVDRIEATATELSDADLSKAVPEGGYVHVFGMPKAESPVRDGDTGFTRDVLVLRRHSQILQWVETPNYDGGNRGHRIEWTNAPVDSTQFRRNGDGQYFNAGRILYPTKDFATPLGIAGKRLSARFMDAVWEWTSIPILQSDLDAMPTPLRDRFEIRKGDLFTKGNAVNGSVWTSYDAKRAHPTSLIGVMHGDRIDPIDLGDGKVLAKFGRHSASELMAQARSSAVMEETLVELGAGAAGAVGFAFAAATFIDERKSRPRPPAPAVVWGRG
jgi:hypothetical protein